MAPGFAVLRDLCRGGVAGLLIAAPALAELTSPAEVPPADFAGQQYVDSKGCLFLRAGRPGNVAWIARVTRDGQPLCGNPPSGNRVQVIEEGAATTFPATGAAPSP
jgi:hypothetical protein